MDPPQQSPDRRFGAVPINTTSPTTEPVSSPHLSHTNNSLSSTDSFNHRLFLTRNKTGSFASLASPDIPNIKRTQFKSNYGTLSTTPFANLDDYADEYHDRPRGRSEHMDEEPTAVDHAYKAHVTAGTTTLSPYDLDGRPITTRGQYWAGDYQRGQLWAERNTPGTNQTRKLRELSTAFDQYVRSRRKVIFITYGMAAAFVFLCGMTSRMSGGTSNNHRNRTIPTTMFSISDTDTDTDTDTPTTHTSPSASTPVVTSSTALAAWYLAVCYTAAMSASVGSFLFLWVCSLRKRVTLSMLLMLAPLIVLILVETSTIPTWQDRPGFSEVVMVLAGTSWGIFLPTVLSMVTPHGRNTKLWLTLGIPCGSLVVEILFVVAEGTTTHFGTDAVTITAGICLALIVLGLCIHLFAVPNVHVDHNGDSVRSVCSALRNICLWMRLHLCFGCIAVFMSSACVSMFSVGAISMALEKHTTVSLFGDASQWVIPEGLVLGLYASFGLIGSLMGRKMAFMVQPTRVRGSGCLLASSQSPFAFLTVTLLGALVIAGAFKINWGVLLPLGVFLLGYGSGFVKNMMVRYVDEALPKEANLVGFVLLTTSSMGGCCLVWSFPVWVKMATWMGK